MSKTIKIPEDRGSRVIVVINGVTYVYKAGITVTVPDEVAAAIAIGEDMKPKPGNDMSQQQQIDELRKSLKEMQIDLDTVSEAVEDLDDRMDAVDTPETGELALLDARVTALEQEDTTPDTTPGT